MNDPSENRLQDYLRQSESWSSDRERSQRITVRASLVIAGVLGVIALLEAIALVSLVPLKTAVPYTLLVDKQTGHVQALKPLDQVAIAPDTALSRSFLAQYVIAREGFDIDSLQEDYKKVALLSAGEARERYLTSMQSTNPASPLATLPRRAIVAVEIHSLVSLNADTTLIRFATIRTDPGGQAQGPQLWEALLKYRFSRAEMSAADRLTNPLGFQVVRYRKTAEIPPPPAPKALQTAAPALVTQPRPGIGMGGQLPVRSGP
jgi:type IV secretion system protein VirB8